MRLVEGLVTVSEIQPFLDQVDRIAAKHDCTIQAVDARYIAGPAHVRTAIEHADRAFDRGNNIARDRGLEILLYLAGTRQIEQALSLGLEAGETPTVFIIDGDREAAAASALEALSAVTPQSVTLGDPDRLCEWFAIGQPERDATDASLESLVRERVALLAVNR